MILTPAQRARALDLALRGELVVVITRDLELSPLQFYNARITDPKFADAFLLAQRDGAERMAAKLVQVSKRRTVRVRNADGELVRVAADDRRDRLAVETAQWFLARKHPSVWGQRVDVQVSASLSLAPQLAAARARSPATPQLLDAGAIVAVALSEPLAADGPFDAASDDADGDASDDDPAGAYR